MQMVFRKGKEDENISFNLVSFLDVTGNEFLEDIGNHNEKNRLRKKPFSS